MKGIVLMCGMLLTFNATAGKITMQLTEQTETANGKVCIYENATRTEMVQIKLSEQCKYTRTFEED